ncbi:MAG: methyltransferase domain-containing protein [archaeon]|nr:MAG: methyltransferase domain-containing protein [archaeon]
MPNKAGPKSEDRQAPSLLPGKPDYGTDDPVTIFSLLAAGILVAASGFSVQFLRSTLGPLWVFMLSLLLLLAGLIFIGFGAGLYLGRKAWKPREVARLAATISWGGNEVVLDIGSGRGMFANTVAARLKDGLVVSLDRWRPTEVTGNSPASLLANARICGTESKISLVMGEPTHLPFKDRAFDAVVSGMALHRLKGSLEMRKASVQVIRVLKDGGRVALLIAGNSSVFEEITEEGRLKEAKVSRLRLGLLPPAHSIEGRVAYHTAEA